MEIGSLLHDLWDEESRAANLEVDWEQGPFGEQSREDEEEILTVSHC